MSKTTKPTKPCKHNIACTKCGARARPLDASDKKDELEIELLDLKVREASLGWIGFNEIHKILDGRKSNYIV